MASEVKSSGDGCRKKIKLSSEKGAVSEAVAEDLSSHARLSTFEGFKLKQILSDNNSSKSMFVEGSFETSDDCAVILLEKLPFSKDSIDKLLNNADLALNLKINSTSDSNVVNYAFYPKVERGDMKATVIYPANSKHVEKYLHQSMFIVHETAKIYESIVLPHILSQKFSIQWVYNILEHNSETERFVYEDPDPETGFILLPDMKWDDSDAEAIYLIAICHTRTVKSLRDLTDLHLPLLNNIKSKGLDVISKKYSIPHSKLRVYLHYQPSYYHLHVHFRSIHGLPPGVQFEKAHLLDTVISNIELSASYYQKITLTYTLKENDPLLQKLKTASMVHT